MNQAAVEAYKAQQKEIIDASKAKASEIKLSDQQSAKDILETQRKNNEATAQYVDNYNTIWGQIPVAQREYLAELGVDSARFLQEMVAKWDAGGKEQWDQYVAGIEAGKATASEKAGGAAEEVSDAFIAGTESKGAEAKQAGTSLADEVGAGMEASTAPSVASQEIANAVIADLLAADYSSITAGIAAAITAGTTDVVAAAKSMASSTEPEIMGMKTQSESITKQMMAGINSEIVRGTSTIRASATSTTSAVTAALSPMIAQGSSTATQMMTGINSTIITHTATIRSSATAAANGVTSSWEPMVTGGINAANRMMDGMLAAMNAKAPILYAKAREIADNISKTISDALKVQSPSRVMIDIFQNVMLGIYKGMESMEGRLYRLADKISCGLSDRLTISPDMAMGAIDHLKSIVDANPFRINAAMPAPAYAGGTPGVSYNTNLTQNITTPKPLSPSEMTREGQDLLRRSKWQLP